MAKVSEESLERIAPLLAHRYSPASISFKRFIGRVITSPLSIHPCLIFGAACLAVCAVNVHFSQQAAATFTGASPQGTAIDLSRLAAAADAIKIGIGSYPHSRVLIGGPIAVACIGWHGLNYTGTGDRFV